MFQPVVLLKNLIKKILYVPWRINSGSNVMFRHPWWVLNRKNVSIGPNSRIGRYCVFHPVRKYAGFEHSGQIFLGTGVYLGGHCQLHAMSKLEIGDECVLSEHVYISDIAHGFDPEGPPILDQPLESKGPVSLGKRVFVGYGSSVLSGVTLGDGCIVGTRSVVTKSFPPYSVIAGSPAKVIKRYDFSKKKWVDV